MQDYEALLTAKNAELAHSRGQLDLMRRELRQTQADLERVSLLLGEADRVSGEKEAQLESLREAVGRLEG
jgi:hypothetical protein